MYDEPLRVGRGNLEPGSLLITMKTFQRMRWDEYCTMRGFQSEVDVKAIACRGPLRQGRYNGINAFEHVCIDRSELFIARPPIRHP